ncbi:MAG: TlpA family protein disulfide reductase, partial [Muribaculaceae bacterium]|nr:TlpA family protein disulfide reductase [Muribaculaceae bacterium]
YKKSLHTGKYSDYDRAADAANPADYRLPIGDRIINMHVVDYHMTGEEYKNKVKELYQALSEYINNADMSQGEKEYHMLQLQSDVLKAIINHRRILEGIYRFAKRDWTPTVPADSVPAHLTEKDYQEVAGWFDISNPKLLMTDHEFGTTGHKPGLLYWSIEGGPGELSKSLYMFGEKARSARRQTLSETDMADLKSLPDPFFASACDSIAKRTAREYLELQKTANVTQTPEVADDKVFEAIIAPYIGKVVIVDLWNTWCGPCRVALKHNEPLKTGGLSNDDIVWIYIADESSDPVKYLEMIPDIKGIHYKVNADQIKAIREQFKVDGIPYYILVDREGNAEGRPDLRNHSRYIEAILSKCK